MVRRLVALGTVLLALAWLLGLLGGLHWRLDLLAHFRVQMAGVALALGLVAAAARAWRWAALAGGLLAGLLAGFVPYLGSAGAASGPRLVLAHFNVLSSNTRYADVAAWISGSGADVVFVQEVDPEWATALARVPGYRVVEVVARADNFGLAVLASETTAAEILGVERAPEIGEVPALVVALRHAGRELAVLSVHTLPPVSATYAATRDAQLVAAAIWARAQQATGRAAVVLGDLNATPFSAAMAPLKAVPGLRDSLQGGLRLLSAGTWPAWPVRIAIDHCWHADALVAVDRVVGPALGSDHRPLVVSLAWAD